MKYVEKKEKNKKMLACLTVGIYKQVKKQDPKGHFEFTVSITELHHNTNINTV